MSRSSQQSSAESSADQEFSAFRVANTLHIVLPAALDSVKTLLGAKPCTRPRNLRTTVKYDVVITVVKIIALFPYLNGAISSQPRVIVAAVASGDS